MTIQLPLYNERYVVERLLEEVSKMEYPRELLQIQVLDDSTDDTHPFTEALVREYQAAGLPIEYLHRNNRAGFKAGALQEGMKTATGELIAIFDADFIPPRDFLARTVHHFTDPGVGVVQTRWSYLNRHYNLLTEVEAMLLDGHFVIEHGARFGSGLFFNFNGTAGVLRAKMIEDAGGWQHDTLTEDSDLSYRAQLKGWRFVYVPSVDCPSELPVDTYGFQVQQSRWAKGLTQVAIKLLPRILRSKEPWRVKLEAFCHLTPNISYPLMLIMSALMLPVMIVRFYMGVFQMLTIDLPLIIASFWSIWAFYLMAQRELHPQELEARHRVDAGPDGRGYRADVDQHQGGDRSAARDQVGLCAHAQVCGRRPQGENSERELPAPQRLAALRGTGDGRILRLHGRRTRSRPGISWPFRSCCCLWWVIGGLDSRRSIRNIRASCSGSASARWRSKKKLPDFSAPHFLATTNTFTWPVVQQHWNPAPPSPE